MLQYSVICVTKRHILLFVNKMSICIPVVISYRLNEHKEKKHRIYFLLSHFKKINR